MRRQDLITPEYEDLNRKMHASARGFGHSGKKHASEIFAMCCALQQYDILDYGCGAGTLKEALMGLVHVKEYDPAVEGKDTLPTHASSIVVCTDVLEHVEANKLDNVLGHLHDLTLRFAFLVIATGPGSKTLEDGTDTHRVVESHRWWYQKLSKFETWKVQSVFIRKDSHGMDTDVSFWLRMSTFRMPS